MKTLVANPPVVLPALCWRALKQCLNAPGWATTPRDYRVAGNLDGDDRIQVSDEPSKDRAEEEKELSVVFSKKEFEVIGKALDFFVTRGALSPNKWTVRLLTTFEVEGMTD